MITVEEALAELLEATAAAAQLAAEKAEVQAKLVALMKEQITLLQLVSSLARDLSETRNALMRIVTRNKRGGRNREMLDKRKADPEHWTLNRLAKHYGISRRAVSKGIAAAESKIAIDARTLSIIIPLLSAVNQGTIPATSDLESLYQLSKQK